MRSRPRAVLVVVLGVVLLCAAACGRAPAVSPGEVAVVRRAALPADPADAAWRDVAVHPARLVVQDMVEPRLLEASTPEVRVQAVSDGARIAFRLEWADPTRDDTPGPGRFVDACAVQLPARAGADAPAPQMGEAGRRVEISYWRSSWQAVVDGRGETLGVLYPNAAVDHYPFEAAPIAGTETGAAEALRFAPARAAGSAMAGPRDRSVEDLVAEGPGTLSPAPARISDGRGVRTADGWAVVLTRPIPEGLAPGARGQVAFAVWEGSRGEVGSRKMRTAWIPLAPAP